MAKKQMVLYGEGEVNRLIHVVKEESRTTSLRVAEAFGKRHDNVIQGIENLGCSEAFTRLNFQVSEYEDSTGRKLLMYEMTKNGFSFLVMGFTGKKASEWKEKYIAAFDRMEQELVRLKIQHTNPDWQAKRIEGKAVRREFTDAIKALEEYILERNPSHRHSYYDTYTKMTYSELYILESKKIAKNFRDLLDRIQLIHLSSAEIIISDVIYDEMENGTEYHEIFKIVKTKIEAFVAVIGKTLPGQYKALRPAPLALAR